MKTETLERDSTVVAILEKMGYTVSNTVSVQLNPKADDIEKAQRQINNMYLGDKKLWNHTLYRIESMSEAALLARVKKITDKEKMLYFAKGLMERRKAHLHNGCYSTVLRQVLEVIIEKGWA